MAGITLDSGALIAYQKHKATILGHIKAAYDDDITLTVPAAVLAEAWRGGPGAARIALLLQACVIEDITEPLAKKAGVAAGNVANSGAVDAMVMASAGTRGDIVLTTDYWDLNALKVEFPNVGIVKV